MECKYLVADGNTTDGSVLRCRFNDRGACAERAPSDDAMLTGCGAEAEFPTAGSQSGRPGPMQWMRCDEVAMPAYAHVLTVRQGGYVCDFVVSGSPAQDAALYDITHWMPVPQPPKE